MWKYFPVLVVGFSILLDVASASAVGTSSTVVVEAGQDRHPDLFAEVSGLCGNDSVLHCDRTLRKVGLRLPL